MQKCLLSYIQMFKRAFVLFIFQRRAMKMKRILTIALVGGLLLLATIASASAETITIQPGPEDGKDAFVTSTYPDATNYHAFLNTTKDDLLTAGYWYGGATWYKSFLKFDVSEIPAGSTINSAELKLYNSAAESLYTATALSVARLTSDWSEDNVSWNNQPGFLNYPASGIWVYGSGLNNWHNWNVIWHVQDWVDGTAPNYGFILEQIYPVEDSYYVKEFFSSDYMADPSLRPKLVVDYTPPPISVQWLEPLNHSNTFILQDGTTLPIKFSFIDWATGQPKQSLESGVYLQIVDTKTEEVLATYPLGDGRESLRWNELEYYYIANFQTKNYLLKPDNFYEAVVRNSNEKKLGSVSFLVDPSKGISRGRQP